MEFGLLTLQRVNDLAHLKSSDIHTEHVPDRGHVDFLYVIQEKTKKHGKAAYLKIEINPALAELIQRCRDKVASPFILHRRPERIPSHSTRAAMKTKTHYTQLSRDYISHQFADYRDKTGLFNELSLSERPTFHEIRSLGIARIENQGSDAQALAGHTSRRMTEHYKKGHDRIQWTTVAAAPALMKQHKK